MLSSYFHKHSAVRIFFFSGILTFVTLAVVFAVSGPAAFLIALALIVIEVTFSFDNAVINARILRDLSPFWQKIFLTVGIAIAVFGMRIIFPIAIVAATTPLNWHQVLDFSLHQPDQYSEALQKAEPIIAGFGSAFLLMLALHFFTNRQKKIHWLSAIEKPLAALPGKGLYAVIVTGLVMLVSFLPSNHHKSDTLKAGIVGVILYLIIHGLSTQFMTKAHHKRLVKTGVAGFMGFLYLEVLDASFSLDGVIGAFALTNKVLLIAAGLGVGAIWVRSTTVYLVRKETLNVYRYLEHGAHYAIGILAMSLMLSIFWDVPEVLTGLLGITVIALSGVASHRANKEAVGELAQEVEP